MSDAVAVVDALLADERTASAGIVALLIAQSKGFMSAHEVHVRLPFTHLHDADCECRQ